MLRKIIFWSHLVAGVVAGAVILMMSFTGVLITYEYQMIENADMKMLAVESQGQPLDLEQIMLSAGNELNKDINGVVLRNVPNAPYQVSYDRRGGTYVNQYTGELLGSGSEGIRNFLAPIREWHRWFNVSGQGRDTARAITGASNAIFLFILISGLYLWFPRVAKAITFRIRVWFKKGPNSKFRDYNWHHVFGIWSLIPLIAIVFTGMGFSYPTVKNFVSDVFAEPGQEQARPQGGGGGRGQAPQGPAITAPAGSEQKSLGELIAITQKELDDDWYKISASPARNATSAAEIRIGLEKSLSPTKDLSLSINPYTGEIVKRLGWEQMTTQAKANQVMRRLHTGEFYGVIGQTIAGIVSLFACIMVYTGIALAWRRLISPLLKKRKKVS